MRRFAAIATSVALAGLAFAGDDAWKKEKEIALGPGGCDYLTVDAAARRLYVSHGAAVDVIDLEKGEKVASIPGVDGAHGTAIAPEQKRGFCTAGKKQKVVVFDTETNKVVKEVDSGEGPD